MKTNETNKTNITGNTGKTLRKTSRNFILTVELVLVGILIGFSQAPETKVEDGVKTGVLIKPMTDGSISIPVGTQVKVTVTEKETWISNYGNGKTWSTKKLLKIGIPNEVADKVIKGIVKFDPPGSVPPATGNASAKPSPTPKNDWPFAPKNRQGPESSGTSSTSGKTSGNPKPTSDWPFDSKQTNQS